MAKVQERIAALEMARLVPGFRGLRSRGLRRQTAYPDPQTPPDGDRPERMLGIDISTRHIDPMCRDGPGTPGEE
jgi:hypothetical protein